MSVPFARTLRAVDASSRGRQLGIGIALCMAAVWAGWAALGQVTVYEQSVDAQLVAMGGARRLSAPVAARVAEVLVAPGDAVRVGQALVRLDDREARVELARAQASVGAIRAQAAAARSAVDAARVAAEERGEASFAALAEAEARVREARVLGELASRQATRTAGLAAGGAVSSATLEQDRTAAEAQAAAASSARSARTRAALQTRVEQSEQAARLATMEQEVAALDGERVRAEAAVEVLELQLARYVLRAPVDGRVLRVGEAEAGERVTPGADLVEVVPDDTVVVKAHFAPGQAIGRIRASQAARVRLDGFPWTEFGHLDARVARVSGASPEGTVEVQLVLDPAEGTAIPLQHGLTGEVEVAVEQVSPAQLALRTAGGAGGHR